MRLYGKVKHPTYEARWDNCPCCMKDRKAVKKELRGKERRKQRDDISKLLKS